MKCVIIACRVLYRELSYLCSKSPNTTEVIWLEQGLHNTPDKLRQTLIDEIDKIEARKEKPDMILLGYGLCSNGIIGIKSKTIPIAVPKCDDCIALFLGSQKRYLEYFNSYPGTYWYNPGWLENAFTPSEESLKRRKQEYIDEYGEENGEYVFSITHNYVDTYKSALYITSPIYDNENYVLYAKNAADYLNWQFHIVDGKMDFLSDLVDTKLDDKFLVINPGEEICESFDENKIKSKTA